MPTSRRPLYHCLLRAAKQKRLDKALALVDDGDYHTLLTELREIQADPRRVQNLLKPTAKILQFPGRGKR